MATAATAITVGGFSANWGAVTGADSYRLDVSTSNTFGTYVPGFWGLNVNDATTYAVTGLAGGTTYYYRLRAVNASGTSADSNTITVLTVVTAPVATAATSVNATGFAANWGAVTGADSYRLDVSTSNTFGTYVPGFWGLNVNNATTYAVTGLAGGTTYYYRLRAVNASGTSADSNVITVLTVPAAPVATTATAITATGFGANWGAVTGAVSYRLDVSTSNTFGSFVAGYQDQNVGNVLTYAVTGLAGGSTYYYRLRAVNASGTSADSNVITVLTMPAAPAATGHRDHRHRLHRQLGRRDRRDGLSPRRLDLGHVRHVRRRLPGPQRQQCDHLRRRAAWRAARPITIVCARSTAAAPRPTPTSSPCSPFRRRRWLRRRLRSAP